MRPTKPEALSCNGDYMTFDQEYSKLNTAQKQAVDTLDGPVLVIAGPGTGKTQLLSMRVANILKQTDTDARNILCLTFTNKAATNMRSRLQDLTDGEARNVHIKTFHGFAAEIMNSYSQYFWNGANLQSAPEAVQLSILQNILSKLPLDNAYTAQFYGTYTMLGKAQKAIARAKEAGLTPEKLRVLLQANLAYIDEIEHQIVELLSPILSFKKLDELEASIQQLPEQPTDAQTAPLISLASKIKESLQHAIELDQPLGKTTHTGAWKKQWLTTEDGIKGMHKERRYNVKYLQLADIYENYRDQLHKRGFYDYADMLLEVIVQLENRSDLRAEVQERFSYVLIDEFQDSNSAQLRLAHLIADHHSSEGKPNIMAVGDDDQSIYGFNGAELNNMLHFNRTYGTEAVTTVILTQNYRSTNEVLRAADTIIQNSEDRLVDRLPNLTKQLTAMASDLPTGEISHVQYKTKEQQYFQIAKDIQKTIAENPSLTMAVLARSHKSLEPLAAQLHGNGVSIRYERQQNIFEHEAIAQIITICRAVVALGSGNQDLLNALLSDALRHPMFSVESNVLWELAVENRYDAQWLSSMLAREETKEIAEWLSWLATEASYQPLSVMLEHILGIRDDSPQHYIHQYYIADQQLTQSYIETLSAVRLFREQVREFSLQDSVELSDFLEFIDTEVANNKVLSDNSAYVGNNYQVELLSVHKAKGLEFDCVYIVDAVEKDWQPSGSREGVPSNLPLQPPLESSDEYARLMYVAATRAKHTIIFTSYATNDNGEEVLATPLIHKVPTAEVDFNNTEVLIATLESDLAWPRLTRSSEKEVLSGILENFSINATNLLTFLDVTEGGPSTFLERSLLRLPSVKGDFMSHGTAIHAALELAQKLTNLDSFNSETVKEQYRRTLLTEQLPKDRLEQQITHGENTLDRLFNEFEYRLKKGSVPEQSLPARTCGKARIGGKLDRVDFVDEQTLRIVDYKTGSGLSSLETKDKNKEIKAWKHKTQLTFYALLAQCDQDLSKYKTFEGQMVYVESSYQKGLELSYIPSSEEVERLTKIVAAMWNMVKNYELPNTLEYTQDLAGIRAFEDYLLSTVDQ